MPRRPWGGRTAAPPRTSGPRCLLCSAWARPGSRSPRAASASRATRTWTTPRARGRATSPPRRCSTSTA
eukprot:3814120-Lingulodinium_polyedra.AAC.1